MSSSRPETVANRRFFTLLGAAACVGLAARVFYVLSAVRGKIVLSGDSETYHLLGQVLANGDGYVRPRELLWAGRVVPTAEFPPIYPMFLGALDLVGVGSVTGQRLAGTVLGAVTIVLIGMLGAAVAGRPVGVAAAWIAALYPQFITFDGSLLSEGLFAALVTTALLGVVKALHPAEPQQTRWWAVASVATGVAVLTRTEALLLVPLVLIPATFVPGDFPAWRRRAALVSAGSVTTVTAWTIRNAFALDRFQPFTSNSGTALAGSNCDATYNGPNVGAWRFDCLPTFDSARTAESAFAGEARQAGLDYISGHLSDLPRVISVRLARTFGLWDIRTSLFFESLEGRSYNWLWAAWIGWLLVAGFAVIGIVSLRGRHVRIWPLLMPIAIVALMTMITYGNQRFRMVAEPGLVVLAAAGLVHSARSARLNVPRPAKGSATAA